MSEYQPLSDDEVKKELESLPNWEVRDGWLRREYKTPGFPHSLLLANTIGYLAEAAWHHPDLSVGYAQVTVKLRTHRANALTRHDVALARKIEEVILWKPGEGSPLGGFPKNWVH
jgi:4a-hydroxytetrahydrobiopterin dehydratase